MRHFRKMEIPCTVYDMAEGVPRLYELHCADDETGTPVAVAWGMTLPDGRTVTAWPEDGAGTGIALNSSVESVRRHLAPLVAAYLVWR